MEFVVCPDALRDPGVFQLLTATGRDGTACGGVLFVLEAPDPFTGEVELVPTNTVSLGPSFIGGPAATCIIDLTWDVLKLPSKDANGLASDGRQTTPLARAVLFGQTSEAPGVAGGATHLTVTFPNIVLVNVARLLGLIQTFDLTRGSANSLTIKLERVIDPRNAGLSSTCGHVQAFIAETRAQSGKSLTAAQADDLTAGADQIGRELGCDPTRASG